MDLDFFQYILMEKVLVVLLLVFLCVCVRIMLLKYQFIFFDIVKKFLLYFYKVCWYFFISFEVYWLVFEEKLQVILKFSKIRVLYLLYMFNIFLLRYILLLFQKISNFNINVFKEIF